MELTTEQLRNELEKANKKIELLSATLDKVGGDALKAKMSLNKMEKDYNKLVIENNLFHKLYVKQ
jgi:multidrug resistance efflux pump